VVGLFGRPEASMLLIEVRVPKGAAWMGDKSIRRETHQNKLHTKYVTLKLLFAACSLVIAPRYCNGVVVCARVFAGCAGLVTRR